MHISFSITRNVFYLGEVGRVIKLRERVVSSKRLCVLPFPHPTKEGWGDAGPSEAVFTGLSGRS